MIRRGIASSVAITCGVLVSACSNAESGGTAPGGSSVGGASAAGSSTGGNATGGSSVGGASAAGSSTGGTATGGTATGGNGGATSGGGSGGNAGTAGAAGATPSTGCGVTTPPASGRFTISVDDTMRDYILALPDDYDPNRPYRLIFGWHPRGGSAESVATGFGGGYYGLQSRANGSAIFVAPEGIDAGWANTGGRDIAFLRAMLERFRSELCIDESPHFFHRFQLRRDDVVRDRMRDGRHLSRDRTHVRSALQWLRRRRSADRSLGFPRRRGYGGPARRRRERARRFHRAQQLWNRDDPGRAEPVCELSRLRRRLSGRLV